MAELEKYINELKKHQYYTLEDLQKDVGKQWIAAHGLQLAVQIVLDVSNHILADRGVNAQDYTDVIDKMGEHAIIPLEFAQKIPGHGWFPECNYSRLFDT